MKHWYIAVIALVLMAPTIAAAQEFRTHVVKPGETCTSIAKDFYGDAHAYDNIHEYNDLSGDGYACRPGVELKLPILPKAADAKVTARAGDLRAKSPEQAWKGVDVGAELFESWSVSTLEKSRAELGFRDRSRLQMTENTLVIIYGPSDTAARTTVSGRASVEKGRLRTRLADLSGAPLQVQTPSAIAELSDGNAQITVDDDGESRVANHTGKSIKVRGLKVKQAVNVKSGYGSRVKKDAAPEKPRLLPKTPLWEDSFSPIGLALGAGKAVVSASWKPVDAAETYHVEVTRDRRQLDVIASQVVPKTINSVELRQLPPGDYFISIVAIDKTKFESIPSMLQKLTISKLRVKPEYIVDDQGTVLLGADIGAPSGLTCTIDSSESLSLSTAGPKKVECRREGLTATIDINVVLPKITIGKGDLTLVRGAMRSVELTFDPAVPPNIGARSAKGLEVKAAKVSSNTLNVNLAANQQTQLGKSEVDVVFGDLVLSGIPVEVLSPDQAKNNLQGQNTPVFLSLLAGYDAVSVDPYWSDDFPAGGGALEFGVGVMPTDYFAGELRVGLSVHSGDTTESVMNIRGQAMAGWFTNALAPYLGLGINWRNWFDGDARVAAQGAIGIMPALSESLRLRVEAGAGITPISGSLQYLPEARAGVVFTF